jgi:hypothetical protein
MPQRRSYRGCPDGALGFRLDELAKFASDAFQYSLGHVHGPDLACRLEL